MDFKNVLENHSLNDKNLTNLCTFFIQIASIMNLCNFFFYLIFVKIEIVLNLQLRGFGVNFPIETKLVIQAVKTIDKMLALFTDTFIMFFYINLGTKIKSLSKIALFNIDI